MPQKRSKVNRFWQELKRRKVIKVIAMYAATAFIIIEAADNILSRLGLPDWTVTFLIIMLIVGFPITIILSWIFDVTPEGIEKVFMVHYLSSFIINYILLDKLKSQENARIILVNSEGHRFAAWGLRLDDLNWEKRRYSGIKSYGSAKTAQLLSMIVFNEHFKNIRNRK